MSDELIDALHDLARKERMLGKGFLGLALVITDRAAGEGLPIDPASMMTKGGGQVSFAGGAAVAKILARHGIFRRLSSEGGRTSRGTPAKMRAYLGFLNAHVDDPGLDLWRIELFWVVRVRDFFASMPFVLELDPATGVKASIRKLIAEVEARQRETPGATLVGTVVQHLIGAKIEIVLGCEPGGVARHGASVNDASDRGGDFEIGDTVIHVTTAPGQLLIEKCRANVVAGFKPVIVTGRARLQVADGLLDDAGLGERVDVLDYEGFLVANVFEIGRFEAGGRREAFEAIVKRYNEIVEAVEGDPSLKIEIR